MIKFLRHRKRLPATTLVGQEADLDRIVGNREGLV